MLVSGVHMLHNFIGMQMDVFGRVGVARLNVSEKISEKLFA